ncbi:MAG: nucleotidyltransferase family protein [Synergistaceae bacterium]|jgi:predicted nucleotidyltransferase|nr:nucleotidyltransferase family protein [Synergistaceae bacterium]
MKKISQSPVIGIVAEYNPFHNGHALHIARAREFLKNRGADNVPVVVVLSSNFTQRGLPALADKWTRARMALSNGVDLVLELPFAYACNAAPEFARGAVDILAATRFVTHLSFGMENVATSLKPTSLKPISSKPGFAIDAITNILIHESCAFKRDLKKKLSEGKSYPKALAETLDGIIPGSGAFVSMPNNSLALSYLLRVLEKNHDLELLPVQRQGAGHHDKAGGPLSSAAAIRSALAEIGDASWNGLWIQKAMPASSLALLEEERKSGRLWMRTEKLWALLQGLLARSSPEELRGCAGMNEGLENLFLKRYVEATSYEDFIGRCVCARYTRSRLQRQATRCLVGVDRWTALALSRNGPPYIRVLGYTSRGRDLLRARRQISHAALNAIPVVTRLAAAQSPAARASAALEFRASRFRELLLPRPDLRHEEKQRPVAL